MTSISKLSLGTLGLVLLLACGGGGGGGGSTPATPAATLDYTNPSSPQTFRLVKNVDKSTAKHLVLDVVAPAGKSITGLAFYLNADSNVVTWAKAEASDAELIQNVAFPTSALQVKAKATGGELQAGIFFKGKASPLVTTDGQVIARIALDLKTGAGVSSNVSLAVPANKAVQFNTFTESAPTTVITVAPGTLAAK